MAVHQVALVPVRGEPLPVRFLVAKDGIHILANDEQKDLDHVGFSHIIKWLPSSLRSRNAGPDNCLDIQLDTVNGKRDVRLQCQSADHVAAVINELKDVVKAIMQDRSGSPTALQGLLLSPAPSAAASTPVSYNSPGTPAERNSSSSTPRALDPRPGAFAAALHAEEGASKSPGGQQMLRQGSSPAPQPLQQAAASTQQQQQSQEQQEQQQLRNSGQTQPQQLQEASPRQQASPPSSPLQRLFGRQSSSPRQQQQQLTEPSASSTSSAVPSQQPSALAAPESPHRQPSPLKQLLRRSSEALARISSMRSSGSGTGGDSPLLGSPRRTRTSWTSDIDLQVKPVPDPEETTMPELMPTADPGTSASKPVAAPLHPSLRSPSKKTLSPQGPADTAAAAGSRQQQPKQQPIQEDRSNADEGAGSPAGSPVAEQGITAKAAAARAALRHSLGSSATSPSSRAGLGQADSEITLGGHLGNETSHTSTSTSRQPAGSGRHMADSWGTAVGRASPLAAGATPGSEQGSSSKIVQQQQQQQQRTQQAARHMDLQGRHSGAMSAGSPEPGHRGQTSSRPAQAASSRRAAAPAPAPGAHGAAWLRQEAATPASWRQQQELTEQEQELVHESIHVVRPGSAPVYSAGAAAAQQAEEGSGSGLQGQVALLEEMVQRLSAELGKHLVAAGEAAGGQGQAQGSQLLSQDLVDLPLPPWLKDQRYLVPLLAAYDGHIAALEERVAGGGQQLGQLAERTQALASENESLRDELQATLVAMERQAHTEPLQVSTERALVSEQLELLQRENDLLIQQQHELGREVKRLQAALDIKSREVLTAANASLDMQAKLTQQAQELAHAQKQLARSVRASRSSSGHGEVLALELRGAREQLGREQQELAACRRQLAEVQAQQQRAVEQLAGLQAQHAGVAQGEAALQLELAVQREQAAVLSAEARSARQDSEQLRAALLATEQRLRESQARDADAYTRIREASELAEQAHRERDLSAGRLQRLEAEVVTLQQKLLDQAAGLSGSAHASVRAEADALRSQLDQAREQLRSSSSHAAELAAANERLQRQKQSLAAELAGLKEDLVGSEPGVARRVSMQHSATMERLAQAERERDQAAERCEALQREAGRSGREAELAAQAAQAQLRDLTQRLTDSEHAGRTARQQLADAQKQLEAARREAQAARQAQQAARQELSSHLLAAKAAREADARAVAAKLQQALAGCDLAVLEAERMMTAKDLLLGRWKEEAGRLASKLDQAAEHQAQQQEEVAALQQELQDASRDGSHLEQQLQQAAESIAGLQAALEAAEGRYAAADMQLAAAEALESELRQEVKQLRNHVEGLELERAQAGRAQASLVAKVERLKRVQAVAGGRAGQLEGYGEDDRDV